jgi:hypothetical protein
MPELCWCRKHDGGRFGIYFDNQYSRNVRLDENGFVLGGCGEFDEEGRDNGKLTVVEGSLEFHHLFVGQYSLGDFMFKNFISVNNMVCLYWKRSKNFAQQQRGGGDLAHIKDSVFVQDDEISRQGGLSFLGPAGPFTFAIDNLTLVGGSRWGGGGGVLAAGQHCGIFSYNHVRGLSLVGSFVHGRTVILTAYSIKQHRASQAHPATSTIGCDGWTFLRCRAGARSSNSASAEATRSSQSSRPSTTLSTPRAIAPEAAAAALAGRAHSCPGGCRGGRTSRDACPRRSSTGRTCTREALCAMTEWRCAA